VSKQDFVFIVSGAPGGPGFWYLAISPDLFRLSRLHTSSRSPTDIHVRRFSLPLRRFHLYLHDQMKAKFLEENADEQWKTDFIEMIAVPGFEFFPAMSQQRFIKTHLPFKILPPSIMEERAKVVYVARNPKSVVVSYYHLNKLYRTQGYVNDFNSFFEYFMKDLCELKHSPRESHVEPANLNCRSSHFFLFSHFMCFTSALESLLRPH
jgi:Sulfotransferase domain